MQGTADQAAGHKELEGRRVLVVEDEIVLAIDYCQNLAAAGAEVVGPFNTVDAALKCVRRSRIDVAILDYALADETSDPLQCVLESRDIPYVVVTAYPRVLVRRYANQQILSKPVSPDELCSSVRAACR